MSSQYVLYEWFHKANWNFKTLRSPEMFITPSASGGKSRFHLPVVVRHGPELYHVPVSLPVHVLHEPGQQTLAQQHV